MAFLILVGLWNQDEPWPRATNVALLSSTSVVFLLNMPIFGKLLLWKGSQPIAKTQNCQVLIVRSPYFPPSLPHRLSEPIHLPLSSTLWNVKQQEKAENSKGSKRPCSKEVSPDFACWAVLVVSWRFHYPPVSWTEKPTHFSSFSEWKTTSTGCYMPRRELGPSWALVEPGRQAEEKQRPPGPSFQELFSHCATKVESLKGLLVPWCLPSHC